MTRMWRDRNLGVFTINTRSDDPTRYWRDFTDLLRLTEEAGFHGILCFSANETLTDPWLTASFIAAHSRLVPIVAVNPVYMHPFSAAKMVSSIGFMHGRQVILNLTTGTSVRDRQVFGDDTDHAGRYRRLGEYTQIIQRLLGDRGPVTFDGEFYRLHGAVLAPTPDAALQPGFLVAGHSDDAARLVAATGAVQMRMLDPQLAEGLPPATRGVGIHLGIIARDSEAEAWQAARDRFPPDPEREGILDFVMEGNDSVWKRKLFDQISRAGTAKRGYWLEPFGQLRADCPYLVGSTDDVADMLARHIRAGTDCIILDARPDPTEFGVLQTVFNKVWELLDN